MAITPSGFPVECKMEPLREAAGSEKPNNAELAVTFYNAARSESLQRLALREQTVLAWVTVLGVVAGFYFKQGLGDPRLLVLIPVLSLPFSVLIYRHQYVNGRIGEYFQNELSVFLRQPNEGTPRHWDNSKTMRKMLPVFLRVEDGIAAVLLAGVPLAVLILGSKPLSTLHVAWIFVGWMSALISAALSLFWIRRNARK